MKYSASLPRSSWKRSAFYKSRTAIAVAIGRLALAIGYRIAPWLRQEPIENLPDWDDLRGAAPDATGGLPSEVIVRQLRDGWRT